MHPNAPSPRRARRAVSLASMLTTGLAAALAVPATALAVGGPAPGAVTAETVKLPSGPGSVRGLADDASVSAFTGQVQYGVPIELPAGPGGLAPTLSLGYDGGLGNGPLGVGWELTQPGVRRSLRLGVPAYDATDEIELVGLASGQLVPIPGGEYRVEGQGQSLAGRAVGDGFELTDANGMVYRLGATAGARKASGAQVAVWYLEQVRDVAGQTIDYRYHQDLGEVYLDAIEWGPTVAGARAFRVELVYQARPDSVVSFRTGFRVETAQRLSRLRIWSSGGVQRVVDLSYDDAFPLTRLAGVRITSADGTDAMPALGFTYAAAGDGALGSVGGIAGWALNQQGTSLFDVDDDGAMDLLRVAVSGHSWRRNLGGQFGPVQPVPGAASASLDKVRFLDMTGDSIAEMVWQQGSQWRVFQLVRDASGASWVAAGSLAGATNLSLASSTIVDLDGDYRMDVLSVAGSLIQVRMGGAAGLAAPVARPAIDPTRAFIQPGNPATSFPDINGDGLADVVHLATGAMYLYLGRGDGAFEKLHDLAYPWTGTVDASQVRLVDLNRDGLLDVAAVRAGNVSWHRGLAGGAFQTTPVELPRPAGTDGSVVVGAADANGNGSQDLVWSSDAGMWILDMAGPTTAGMLVAIDNGLGQTQAFAYEASTQLGFAAAAAGVPWTTTAPVSIPVSIKNRIQLGSGEPTRSTRLDVRDILYDRGERRFIGFLEATNTRPDPADGAPAAAIARQVQRFAPGLGMDRAVRGQVVYERIESGTGAVLRETVNDVAAVAVAGLPATDARLRRMVVRSTEVRHFEGQSAPIVTRTEYSHDEEGRVIEERRAGRLDLAGDETIARRRYSAGRSARGVTDRICEEWVLRPADGAEPELLETHSQTLYGDDQAIAPLCDAGAGWERVSRQYLDTEDRWIDRKATLYSALGSPIQVTQGGVTRDLEYDASGLRPAAETVHPSASRALRWEMTWDDVLGQPLSVRDASGATLVSTYDGLGRLRSLARMGAAPHIHHRHHLAAPRPYTETFAYDGPTDAVPALPAAWTPASGWRHTLSVSNSAGEPLFDATRLDTDRWLVAARRQRDGLGRTVGIADTFEWQGSVAELVASDMPASAAIRATAYDALDRVTTRTLPTGATSTYAYRAFETTVTTDGIAPVTSTIDGQERVVRTVRTVGGAAESVEATYDAAGRIVSMRLPAAGGAVEHAYEYDTLGRLTFATDPDIGDRLLAYDDGGHLVEQTNGAGQTVEFAYDGAGRLVQVEAGDGSQYSYHYDDALDGATFRFTAGRLAWVEEPTGRAQLGYDELGRQTHLRRSVGGRTADEQVTYGASGVVLRNDGGDGIAFDVAHDPAGRVTAVGDLLAVESQDAAGRPLRERFASGVVETYERDILGQSTRVRIQRPGGASLYDVGVAYTPYGAIASVTDQDGVGLDHTAAFTYDGGTRLVAAAIGTGAGQYRFAYQYDGLQNMVRREAHGPTSLAVLTGQYRYGEPSGGDARGPRQLTSILPDAAAGSPPGQAATAFDYDAAGRLVQQGGLALDYNGFDQLISASGVAGPGGATGTVTHAYGYDGLRVRTVAPDGSGTTWFTRDLSETDDGVRQHDIRVGDRLIARVTTDPAVAAAIGRMRTAVEGAAASRAARIAIGLAGALFALGLLVAPRSRRRHGVRPARAAAGAVPLLAMLLASCTQTASSPGLAFATATQVLYYQNGVSAGPSIITRSDGSVLEERRYEPFGAPIDAYREPAGGGGETGPVDLAADPHNALNKLSDPATGWSDHGARWMAPETGRWLTPDPPVKAPEPKFMSAPWSLHPYQYVNQNPVLYWDPDGKNGVVIEILHKGLAGWEAANSEDADIGLGHTVAFFLDFTPAIILTSWLMIAEDARHQRRQADAAWAKRAVDRVDRFDTHIRSTIGQRALSTGAHVLRYDQDQAARIGNLSKSILALEGAADYELFPEQDWSQIRTSFSNWDRPSDYERNILKANDLFRELDSVLYAGTPETSADGQPRCDGTADFVEVQGLHYNMDEITFQAKPSAPIWIELQNFYQVTPKSTGDD
ncbi:MAG TPA: FG-GAP-like repeat-containing protein [Kofleriaceae bacterium]|nr:FG-GAP-like repeat-containing protein [Kofleriaceae bacterium]